MFPPKSIHVLNALPTWGEKHKRNHVRANHFDILGGIGAVAELWGRTGPAGIAHADVTDDTHRDRALVGHIMIYAMAGRHDAITAWIDGISAPAARNATVMEAMKPLLGSGSFDRAAGTAATITDPTVWGRSLDLIALAVRFRSIPFHPDW